MRPLLADFFHPERSEGFAVEAVKQILHHVQNDNLYPW
jgi:hypothetical protein